MWCIPKVDGEYVARMEDVLDLYAEAPDPTRPVVCFDESPVQLIGEVRQPIPAEPGQLERYDYEYRRNGTVNLFVCIDVHRPWRKVKVTERRAAEDYAQCMRELTDVAFPARWSFPGPVPDNPGGFVCFTNFGSMIRSDCGPDEQVPLRWRWWCRCVGHKVP
jgi:hypothetical protein